MIKEIFSPRLKNPIFIAVWPGMGEVAYRCGFFLKEALDFKMFAKLEAGDFFKPSAVIIEKGIISLPSFPAGHFYYLKSEHLPHIILFLGEAQPPLERAEVFSSSIIAYIKKFKPRNIFTFAAKPEPIDHKKTPEVLVAATSSEILKKLSIYNLKVLSEGQISGLNGIILGVAKKYSFSGACFLAEIPLYTVQIENPKASYVILQLLNHILKLHLNLEPLRKRIEFIEGEIDNLISYIRGEVPQAPNAPLSDEDIDKIKKDLAAYTKLPQSAREKIEDLFQKARKDIAVASILKAELDRWNVYKEYEDKFLDLFRRKDNKNIN